MIFNQEEAEHACREHI